MGDTQDPVDTESNYFNNYPPPKALQKHETLARAFVELQVEKKRRVVLVTSGGTTVPVRISRMHISIYLIITTN
jgi:phosphopantothenate-cysteine ligase